MPVIKEKTPETPRMYKNEEAMPPSSNVKNTYNIIITIPTSVNKNPDSSL
jgi:hypothetical protein